MDTNVPPSQPQGASLPARLFRALTPQQISRIAEHGRRRSTAFNEVLVDVGDKVVPFFVVLSGESQAVRPFGGAETLMPACELANSRARVA